MYKELQNINSRPEPFQFYTAERLWTDEYTSQKMLEFHLNDTVDASSRSGAFIKRSVEWIVSRFKIRSNTAIADFGCGPGLYTLSLAQSGADVTGIDFSPGSINYARDRAEEKGLKIDYSLGNYLKFETNKRFDLVMMIMCDYCALSPEQRKTLLGIFNTILKPDGFVLLDVYSLSAFEERKETALYEQNLLEGFWSPADYYGFLNVFKYDREKIVLDKYTIVKPGETETIFNWLQYFSQDSLQREFEDNGFCISERYSDVAGTPFNPESKEFAITAQKKLD